MSAIPRNLVGINDNMSLWTKQYPSLLTKNFLGIARVWDKTFPPSTFDILPTKTMLFNFQWRVTIDPSILSPYVQEGADTPLSDAEVKFESFVCRETRIGAKISKREIGFGLPDIVTQRTTQLVDAVNRTREFENIRALTGTNVNQPLALARLNTAVAGKPHGSGTAKGWDEAGNAIIADLLAMKTDILKRSAAKAENIYIPINEYEYLHNDSNILDQLKYTQGDLLVNGRITMIKGLKVHTIPSFYKTRNKDGSDTKVFMLQDKIIVTAGKVGFTAVAEPRTGSAPEMERWYERKQRSIFIHAFSSFVPVIEDYGKIGIISGSDSSVP